MSARSFLKVSIVTKKQLMRKIYFYVGHCLVEIYFPELLPPYSFLPPPGVYVGCLGIINYIITQQYLLSLLLLL